MEKEALIRLTEKAYKETLLFPKKEPLRYKIRESALRILEGFAGLEFFTNSKQLKPDLLMSLEVLDAFFEIAKKQNWVKEEEVLAIQQEYANLKVEIESKSAGIQEDSLEKSIISQRFKISEPRDSVEQNYMTGFAPQKTVAIATVTEKKTAEEKVNPRQKTILDFLKENGRAQVWQIKEIMPDISKRTLRRDFEYMLKQGIIKRIGQRNDTFYKIKAAEF